MCDITLRDIDRDDQFVFFLEREMNELEQAAPSDANVSSRFYKLKDGYYGSVDVAFGDGRFTAQGQNHDLESLADNLIEQIWAQIEVWHETRFAGGGGAGDGFQGEWGWFGVA